MNTDISGGKERSAKRKAGFPLGRAYPIQDSSVFIRVPKVYC
jgi:hypothetical protein